MENQVGQLLALFAEWKQHPEDNMPDEWWDEFMEFLKENRLQFSRDTDLFED